MKKTLLILLLVIILGAVVACTQPLAASELKSDKPRETAPAASTADLKSLADGNAAFALNLYRLLSKGEGNIFYSPYSISEALAMTYGGARGETEKQMAAALQFTLPQDKLHAAFNSVDIALAKRGETAQKGNNIKPFRLKVANAIWGQNGFDFTSQYLDLLAVNYGAGMRIVDFMKAAETSRKTINQWVSEQTENKIQELIPPGAVNSYTRLALTNAIYFNASWASPFKKENTQDGQFHLLNGKTVTVPMMHQESLYKYTDGDDYQAAELFYDGNELSMVILLPKEGQFTSFEAGLNNALWQQIIGKLQGGIGKLTLPKYHIESQFSLKQTLTDLGMPDAFSDFKADFSGMDGRKDLFIGSVVHKAYVDVNEEGTEAAAATFVGMTTTSMPERIKDVTLDRPFIFLIRDIRTGAVLFIGRVLNPGA